MRGREGTWEVGGGQKSRGAEEHRGRQGHGFYVEISHARTRVRSAGVLPSVPPYLPPTQPAHAPTVPPSIPPMRARAHAHL